MEKYRITSPCGVYYFDIGLNFIEIYIKENSVEIEIDVYHLCPARKDGKRYDYYEGGKFTGNFINNTTILIQNQLVFKVIDIINYIKTGDANEASFIFEDFTPSPKKYIGVSGRTEEYKEEREFELFAYTEIEYLCVFLVGCRKIFSDVGREGKDESMQLFCVGKENKYVYGEKEYIHYTFPKEYDPKSVNRRFTIDRGILDSKFLYILPQFPEEIEFYYTYDPSVENPERYFGRKSDRIIVVDDDGKEKKTYDTSGSGIGRNYGLPRDMVLRRAIP